jgi:hypothetical protein
LRGRLGFALVSVALALAACGETASPGAADAAQQFSKLYNLRQAAYDKATTALGKSPSAASRAELQVWFDSKSNAEYDFLEGMGKQDGPNNSMNWKITFPSNAVTDATTMWNVSFKLALEEGQVALDMKETPIPSMDNADIAKVNSDLDNWSVSAAKLRRDLGLPAS